MRSLRLAAPAFVLCASVSAASVPARARMVTMGELSYAGADEISASLRSGTARVALPFALIWFTD